jgi:hypothetical protein
MIVGCRKHDYWVRWARWWHYGLLSASAPFVSLHDNHSSEPLYTVETWTGYSEETQPRLRTARWPQAHNAAAAAEAALVVAALVVAALVVAESASSHLERDFQRSDQVASDRLAFDTGGPPRRKLDRLFQDETCYLHVGNPTSTDASR